MVNPAEIVSHLDRLQVTLEEAAASTASVAGRSMGSSGMLLESPSFAVSFHSNLHDMNFADDQFYTLPQTQYSAEAIAMSQLADHLELGQKILATLYSYRSVARAIPQTCSNAEDKRDLYMLSQRILQPEVEKIQNVLRYAEEAAELVSRLVHSLLVGYRDTDGFPSSGFLVALARMLDLLLVMDQLKNTKASLSNDLSLYKRVLTNIKNLTGEIMDEHMLTNHALYNFLATQNAILMMVRDKLALIAGHEELLVDMVNLMATMVEDRQFLTPASKHMLLKAMVVGIHLLDQEGDERSILKRKSLRLERFGKIIKSKPIVPLFGDLSFHLLTLFGKSPRIKELRWEMDQPSEELVRKNYLLVYHLDKLRSNFGDYMLAFTSTMNQAKANPDQVDNNTITNVYTITLRGLSLMSDMTCRVLEQRDASLYEMAVRYNYTHEERLALAECIAMIKSLSTCLTRMDRSLVELVYQHVFITIQSFVRTTLREMMIQSYKKKRPVFGLLLHIYALMSESYDIEFYEDNRKSMKDLPTTHVSPRTCSIALTQLHYIRTLLDATVHERAKGMAGGFLKEKDFKESQVAEVMSFLQQSFWFPFLLNLNETVSQGSDLSELWYKEFYLELTKEIQFPIEMSLPWILTESVLNADNAEMIEFVLYPLGIYNDAAERALHVLRSRYLYDEIEAEVNLGFDQFIWKLSQKVFAHYKARAASLMLGATLKRELEHVMAIPQNDHRFDADHALYTSILQQRRFQLLGRSINISKIVAQFCNQHLRQSLDVAITRYENSDVCGIKELESLVECCRRTHQLLSESLTLDPFEDMLIESNEQMSLVAFNGRVVAHTVYELLHDFAPNFSFEFMTQRFRRTVVGGKPRAASSKVISMYLYGTKQLYLAHNAKNQLYRSYFGVPHVSALIRLLGCEHFNVLVGELSKGMEMKLRLNVTPYIRAIVNGMPMSTKLPPAEYGVSGCFDYFHVILKPILSYSELRTGVFQVFRETGNIVAFLSLLENVQSSAEVLQVMGRLHLIDPPASLMGVVRHEAEFQVKNMMAKHKHVLDHAQQPGSFAAQGTRADILSKPKPFPNLLRDFLVSIKSMVDQLRPKWEDPLPNMGELAVEQSTEFYRIWSALLFALALPESDVEKSERDVFGDGLLWAGAVLIHQLEETGRFEAFDFLRHLLYVSTLDIRPLSPNKTETSQNLGVFLENAKRIQATTKQMLNRLARFHLNGRME